MKARPIPIPSLPKSLRAVVGGIGLVVALLCSLLVPGRLRHLRILRAGGRSLVQGAASTPASSRSTSTPTKLCGNTSACGWPSSSSCRKTTMEPLRQRVFDSAGKVVLEDGPAISGPALRRSAPILVKGVVVGRVEAEASLAPFFVEVGWVTLVSSALGLCAYLAFRVVPLRVLDRTLGELETQNARFELGPQQHVPGPQHVRSRAAAGGLQRALRATSTGCRRS